MRECKKYIKTKLTQTHKFALAWFFFIDGIVLANQDPQIHNFEWYYILPGVLSTISLVM
jgi:hypothetical protein